MSLTTAPQRAIKKWRVIVFTIVSVLLSLFFLLGQFGLPSMIEPWILVESASSTYHPEVHRWHEAIWGVLAGLFLGGSLLILAWQGQKRPLLAQFFVLVMLLRSVTFIAFNPSDPFELMGIALLIIFLLAYPAPRTLLHFARTERISILLLVGGILAGIVLSLDVWRNINLQVFDSTSEHTHELHWIMSADVDVLLIVAVLLTSTKLPGWKALGIITGTAFIYLGVVAIALPAYAGSWGTLGGVIAVLGGINFLVTTFYEARHPVPTPPGVAPAKKQFANPSAHEL